MAVPLAYPATRYAVAPSIDLSDRAERAPLSADAVRAFFNIMARWKVRDEEARPTVGRPSWLFDVRRRCGISSAG